MTDRPATCKADIHGSGYDTFRCSRRAVTDDGYCTQHSPAKKSERNAKAEAKYQAEQERLQSIRAQAERLCGEVASVTGTDVPVTPWRHPIFGWAPGAVVVDVGALEILIKKASPAA